MNGTIHHRFILSLLSFFVFSTSASCVATPCTCDGGRPQGQYCGADFVDPNCIYDHVYTQVRGYAVICEFHVISQNISTNDLFDLSFSSVDRYPFVFVDDPDYFTRLK
ncbi:hypothetical protein RhiirA1_392852 [Rhizophagus irregularis]|uniref:Wall-associated receptor kinase galacturonan-binding domain-containing protein n=1 Tax=Rhizophagus irregularis TaxID=588596 RepID=A0A2N0RYZ0_9GLOM|nr:hypothetical protein RhiirA1_392852 [Rhizophagus irregularis]